MRQSKSGHYTARLRCDRTILTGLFTPPPEASGIVLLCHARVISERAPLDARLLARLHENGLGTFSFGLLSTSEPPIEAYSHRYELAMLAARVRAACEWVRSRGGADRWPFGVLSTGLASAAAFVAAAEQPADVSALVVRAGRPDLAGPALRFVAAPTLFIVGSEAPTLLAANQLAFDQLPGTKSVEIILGGGPDLAEPDAATLAVESAAGWLVEHLCAAEVN